MSKSSRRNVRGASGHRLSSAYCQPSYLVYLQVAILSKGELAVEDMTAVSPKPETPGLEGGSSLPCPGYHVLLAWAADLGIWTRPVCWASRIEGHGCCKGAFPGEVGQQSWRQCCPHVSGTWPGLFTQWRGFHPFLWASKWAGWGRRTCGFSLLERVGSREMWRR